MGFSKRKVVVNIFVASPETTNVEWHRIKSMKVPLHHVEKVRDLVAIAKINIDDETISVASKPHVQYFSKRFDKFLDVHSDESVKDGREYNITFFRKVDEGTIEVVNANANVYVVPSGEYMNQIASTNTLNDLVASNAIVVKPDESLECLSRLQKNIPTNSVAKSTDVVTESVNTIASIEQKEDPAKSDAGDRGNLLAITAPFNSDGESSGYKSMNDVPFSTSDLNSVPKTVSFWKKYLSTFILSNKRVVDA
ncbi:hypothetical protein DdX_03666 [Ditylenchus destructor]|uniref:Uncharacterized protein n=1 Tax=Ditylenchus destructor TaxID=166010 RepID=A0AAD4RBH5_9BILA|nr:hypothetical protein DdX_03666 [Ditylenchus destructor]